MESSSSNDEPLPPKRNNPIDSRSSGNSNSPNSHGGHLAVISEVSTTTTTTTTTPDNSSQGDNNLQASSSSATTTATTARVIPSNNSRLSSSVEAISVTTTSSGDDDDGGRGTSSNSATTEEPQQQERQTKHQPTSSTISADVATSATSGNSGEVTSLPLWWSDSPSATSSWMTTAAHKTPFPPRTTLPTSTTNNNAPQPLFITPEIIPPVQQQQQHDKTKQKKGEEGSEDPISDPTAELKKDDEYMEEDGDVVDEKTLDVASPPQEVVEATSNRLLHVDDSIDPLIPPLAGTIDTTTTTTTTTKNTPKETTTPATPPPPTTKNNSKRKLLQSTPSVSFADVPDLFVPEGNIETSIPTTTTTTPAESSVISSVTANSMPEITFHSGLITPTQQRDSPSSSSGAVTTTGREIVPNTTKHPILRHSMSLHTPPGSGGSTTGAVSRASTGTTGNNNNNNATNTNTGPLPFMPSSLSTPSISNASGGGSSSSSRLRVYKSSNSGTTKWVTRDIAALDFLLGIPMEAEQIIVTQGWMQQQGIQIQSTTTPSSNKKKKGRSNRDGEEVKTEEMLVLEPPDNNSSHNALFAGNNNNTSQQATATTTHHGRWWEKWISHPSGSRDYKSQYSQHTEQDGEELEQPNISQSTTSSTQQQQQLDSSELISIAAQNHMPQPTLLHAPGRRLEGDQASLIQIPLNADTIVTRQRSIARLASIREWEIRVAHGLGGGGTSSTGLSSSSVPSSQRPSPSQQQQQQQPSSPNNKATNNNGEPQTEMQRYLQKQQEQHEQQQIHRRNHQTPMLDGRLFFSASGSYPMGVYSLIRYNPKNEEAVRRRKKLEARGGGGTQFFIMPERDWRGISYSALLPSYNDNDDDMNSVTNKRRRRRQRRLRKKKDRDPSTPGGVSSDALSPDPTVFDRFATSTHRSNTTTSLTTNSTSGINSKNSSDGEHEDDDDDDDASSLASTSSDEDDPDDTYNVGLLDDPEMVQGRHRNVMIGDRVTGCIVSSTIQFVKPSILKADLNKKFRDRFDGWEPPKSQHKYIGARVVDGAYTLMEPGGGGKDENGNDLNSSAIAEVDGQVTIRMPPSLTLSKIRSIKQQALEAAVKAKLELSTVALAFVYFERLCLDCRVDKTNRRLSFAACLLLAIKINESHVGLVMKKQEEPSNDTSNISPKDKNSVATRTTTRLQSLIRPTKKSNNMFASLLEFFTQDWSLSLKHLFAAEWGVFAALQFRLHANPSHVAFHFRRLIKSMGWDPLLYLGSQMYGYWQQSLALEEYQRMERVKRRKLRQQRKEEEKLLHLKRELDAAKRRELGGSNRGNMSGDKKKGSKYRDEEGSISRLLLRRTSSGISSVRPSVASAASSEQHSIVSPHRPQRSATARLNFLLGFGGKRATSVDKLDQLSTQQQQLSISHHGIASKEDSGDSRMKEEGSIRSLVHSSPSMPAIAGSFSAHNDDDFILNIVGGSTNSLDGGGGVAGGQNENHHDRAADTDDEWGDGEGGIII